MISLSQKGEGRPRRTSLPPASPALTRRGPYRLWVELASGGMATIYLASSNPGVGRHRFVALKVIHPHLANDRDFIEMFTDEAEIASRIRHPNVCAVYDFESAPGSQYIAMEYLIGEPLKDVFRRCAREPGVDTDRFTRLVAHGLSQACEGLHAAHELKDLQGDPLEVVHRDVSPENVFLTYDGITKVVDFGVASALRKHHRTSTGVVKGKVAYMSPEVARGAKADRRTDVWGIGVIAYELVTGERLFRRESDVETLRAVLGGDIAVPSSVRPGVSPELERIIMRALSREPSDRYASARELGIELARFAVHRDRPIGPSDIGEWLEQLFPGGRARHEQIIEVAEQLDAQAEAHEALHTPTAPGSQPSISIRIPAPPGHDEQPTQLQETQALRPRRIASNPPQRPSTAITTRALWVAALLVGVGIGLGLFGGLLLLRSGALRGNAIAAEGEAVPAAGAALGATQRSNATPRVTTQVDPGSPSEIVIRVQLEPAPPADPAPRPAARARTTAPRDVARVF